MALKKDKEPKEPKQKKTREPKAPKEKKAKAPKEKAPKGEKGEKEPKKFTNPFKKNNGEQDDGMDILTDVKEPFSLSGFFETHVVERAKRFKTILADKGILFFLMSPFQARGRLIAELLILCIGVMFGVVPRASSLIGALQDQAYASEIAGLQPKTVGSITLTPAASSNYKGVHMIAFVVEGKNLPSDPAKYEVHLARSYGASDWADVTYSWTMYPVTDTKRILLVSIDQTKQASGYGAFKLYVQLEGEEVKDYMREPFEITLSTAQETRDLYDKNGIHLSALTEAICGTGEIAKKQAEFEEAMEKYRVAVEQAEKMPVDIKVIPTPDKLETYCLANRLYRNLDDYSTTEDILTMPEEEPEKLEYAVILESGGIDYDSALVSELNNGTSYSEEEKIILDAFERVETAEKSVLAAMTNVNTAARSWYNTLQSYKLILNQTIKTKSFPLYAKCTATIDDPIDFTDEVPDNSEDEEGGLHGTMTGDDDFTKPLPSGDDRTDEEDPIETVEPVETEEPDDGDGEDTEEPDDGDGEDTEETDEGDGEDGDGEDGDGEDDGNAGNTDTDSDKNKTDQSGSDNKGTGSGAAATPDPADSK